MAQGAALVRFSCCDNAVIQTIRCRRASTAARWQAAGKKPEGFWGALASEEVGFLDLSASSLDKQQFETL